MPAVLRVLVLLLSGWAVWMSAEPQRPAIRKNKADFLLVLPAPMQQALRRFDSRFRPRRLIDYPPLMWRPGCTPTPACSERLYKDDSRATPFAVLGFFDDDNEMDVMVDGDNDVRGRRLVITTSPTGVVVTEVEGLERIPVAVEASRLVRGRWRAWTDGVSESLSFVRAGRYSSPEEAAPLNLSHDGVLVTRTDGRAAIYYLAEGVWKRYVISSGRASRRAPSDYR
jgi:hypothetical protein